MGSRAPVVLAGDRFGRLTVLAEAGRRNGARAYRCRCDCGAEKVISVRTLRKGEARSCGCLHRERVAELGRRTGGREAVHGHATPASPTYRTWASMIQRCMNPARANFPRYGGRGISVCMRWWLFANFLADMGERPEGCSLDRINNDDGYYLDNCRWATAQQQRANQRACAPPEQRRHLRATPGEQQALPGA